MIVEAIAGVAGLATIAGLAVYAIRSVRGYADRALSELDARRVADVSTATMAGDLRLADANTAAWRRTAERQATQVDVKHQRGMRRTEQGIGHGFWNYWRHGTR